MFSEVTANNMSIQGRNLLFGFGVNDADYVVTKSYNGKRINCPYYERWSGLIQRCHSVRFKEKYPTYENASCDERWRYFSDFKSWMIQQKWEGFHLDKDILVEGNKEYSPDKCIFVPQEVNKLFNIFAQQNSNNLPGISINDGGRNRYRARIRNGRKTIGLGSYETPEEAALVWLAACQAKIRKAGDEYSWIHPRFKTRMYEKAESLKLDSFIRGSKWKR